MKMIKPNYTDSNIVNLISSIAQSFGVQTNYNPLKILTKEKLNSKNIVLIVIDGLGYEYLIKKDSILNKYLIGKLTSTFLPSTACAAVSLMTE